MNINFELYRIFYTVANYGNITNASKTLNISQPAISKSIKNLEDQLGGKLFFRTKRGVYLTEEGKEFYKYIKQAMEYISSAENKFTDLINLEAGLIRIGISLTLTREFLLPYLEKFHKLYPKIDIEIMTDPSQELFKKLKNGLVDIVIFNSNNRSYGDDISIIKCKEIHDCFIVNKNYVDIAKKELSLKDLNNYPLILQSKGSNTREFLDKFALDNDVIFKPIMELASYSLVVDFTKIGFGIGYATKEYIKDELDNNEFFELNIKEKIPSRYISIGIYNKNLPNFCTKKLLDIIENK